MEGLSNFGIGNGVAVFGELETSNTKRKIVFKQKVWQLFLFLGGSFFFVVFTKNLFKLVSEVTKKNKHICSNVSYSIY